MKGLNLILGTLKLLAASKACNALVRIPISFVSIFRSATISAASDELNIGD